MKYTITMSIEIERAYDFYKHDKPERSYAVLVDRLWPRGIKKERLQLDEWARQLAPSPQLRKWFDHDINKWHEFLNRYEDELVQKKDELQRLKKISLQQQLILIYGAKDKEHNQAIALKTMLQK